MKKGVGGRILILSLLLFTSIYFFLPSLPVYDGMSEGMKSFFPKKGISLGLDLRGGMHLVLEVEKERAVELLMERRTDSLSDLLDKEGVPFESILMTDDKIRVKLRNKDNKDKAKTTILKTYSNLIEVGSGSNSIDFDLRDGEKIRIKANAIDIALEVIRNRIDPDGVKEPVIQKQGETQILVQVPGEEHPEDAIKLINKIALLEFRLLNTESPLIDDLPSNLPDSVEQQVLDEFKDRVPEDSEIIFETVRVLEDEAIKAPLLVKKRAVLTGDMLTDAVVKFDEFQEPFVSITFDAVGAKLFGDITGKNVGRRLAIVLDGNVYSAPTIQGKIDGGRAQITGSFTPEEAKVLATTLRAGALPAPIKVIENLSVGPSLGKDSIRKGITSVMIAAGFVVIFIMFYYKWSGVIANVALILNLVGLMGAFAMLQATLTLPGIAGIVLTIGIGIDSNVLIMERIREEIRIGRSARLAINAGYDKAFLTIVDSHVTTLITAFVLFLFGTGPIRGFAVGLSLGIVINLFTALVGTKVVYDYLNNNNKIKELSI